MMATFWFDQFTLDTGLYELRRSGEVVPIEPQVFDVLATLLANHDRVVTKDELMETVWGDKFISEAALNSRVMSARKALGDTGRDQRFIRTVHGRGYHFVAPVTTDSAAASSPAGAPPEDIATRPAAIVPSPLAEAPVLLGRDAEMAFLGERLNAAATGQRRVVLVTGEAGLGKTTLVNAFLREVDGAWVARGHCTEHRSEGEPYMPVLEAMGRLCESTEGREVLEHLGKEAPTWLAQMPRLVAENAWAGLQQRIVGATRDRMLREIAECMESLTAAKPLILLLEDLHWSDSSTLDLLDLLARRPYAAKLLVICTFRPTDLAGKLDLYSMTRELTLRGFAEELRLESLNGAAVEALAESRLGQALDAEVAEALANRTGGNPLYVEMVLDAWQAEMAEGIVERPGLAEHIPESLASYIEQRFALLSDEERSLLEAASVVGEEFVAAAIAPALDRDVEAVEAAGRQLARLGKFIRSRGASEWPDGTVSEGYEFSHALYPEVLYRGISPARQARLHQEAGLALERGYGQRGPEHATELAVHFARGRVPDKAVRYLRLAGEQALARSADQEASEHFQQAVDLLPRLPQSPERDLQEVVLRLELGSALVARRGWRDSEVEYSYVRALALARELGDEAHLSAALFANATMHEVRGEYQRAGELMNQRLSLPLTTDLQAQLESCDLLACSEFHRGLFEDSLRHAEQGMDIFRPDLSGGFASMGESPGVSCYDWAGLSSWFLGNPELAQAHVKTALELAELPGNRYGLTLAWTQAAVLYQLNGQAELTLEAAENAIAAAEEHGYAYRVAWGSILRGWAVAVLGDPIGGIAEITDGMEKSLESGARMDHAYYQALLSHAQRLAGDLDGAEKSIDEGLQAIRRERSFFYEAEMLRTKGLILLDRDEEANAAMASAYFEEALRVARTQGALPLQLRAAIEMEKHGRSAAEKRKAHERLRELAGRFPEDSSLPELASARALLEA